MRGWLRKIWKRHPKQYTFVYCPGCKQELVSGSERIVIDTDKVKYFCMKCNTCSVWDFDFPVPVLIDAYYSDRNDWRKHA